MLVDSHCHLDFADFAAERDAVVARARAAGVGTMLTIATRLDQFPGVRSIAEAYPDIWCSVGVHPHEAADHAALSAADLARLAAHPRVVGIGETGLDFHYDHSPREVQERVFRAHIAAAQTSGLPLIIHARAADDAVARMLREERAPPGVMHCFSSGRGLAEAALDLGFYISISGIVTFKNAEELRAIVRDVPLERLLVETDAPYLAPVPYRGRRNEPAYVAATAMVVAALKGVDPEHLAAATTDNFFRLFKKASRPAPPACRRYESDPPWLRPLLGRSGDRPGLGGLRPRRAAQLSAPLLAPRRMPRRRAPDRYLARSAPAAAPCRHRPARRGPLDPCARRPSSWDR